MSKFISRAAFISADGYPGALAMAQRGQLYDALQAGFGLTAVNRTTVSASGALTVDQCGTLQVDASGGNLVLDLPASGSAADESIYEIDRIDTTANTVTIQRAGADTIDGAASVTLVGTMTLRLPAGSTTWRVHGISGATPAKARRALRSLRADVASVAGTVDLTASAFDSDDLRLTGALAVTKFTIEPGRVVRMVASGYSSLANNANIVTQTGATLRLNPGDTWVMRATAPDVVEILLLTRAVPFGYMLVQHQAAVGTNAGSSGAGDQQRPLNATVTNNIPGCSLSSNQVTLSAGGPYYVRGNGGCYIGSTHKIYWKDTTNTIAYPGSNARAGTVGDSVTHSSFEARFTLTAPAVFELRHQINVAQSGNGLGLAANNASAGLEVYATVEIFKEW